MSNPYTRGSSTSPYRVTFHRFVPESPTNRTLFDVLLASELLYFRAEGTIGRVTAPQSISSRSLAEKQFHQQLIHNFAKDHHESLITSSTVLEYEKSRRRRHHRHQTRRYLFSARVWADTCLTLSGFPRLPPRSMEHVRV